MGGAGFEPAKALPPDLQSGPFGRLGIHPFQLRSRRRRGREEPIGFTSNRPSRAGGETRTLNPRFTKPMLCRLSYASNLDREILYYTASLPRCNAFPHSPIKNLFPVNPGALTARQSQLLVRSYPLPRRANKGPLARDRFGLLEWSREGG